MLTAQATCAQFLYTGHVHFSVAGAFWYFHTICIAHSPVSNQKKAMEYYWLNMWPLKVQYVTILVQNIQQLPKDYQQNSKR